MLVKELKELLNEFPDEYEVKIPAEMIERAKQQIAEIKNIRKRNRFNNAANCNETVLKERKVELPPGLRPLKLTDEQADVLRKLLDDPTVPTHAGEDLPTSGCKCGAIEKERENEKEKTL